MHKFLNLHYSSIFFLETVQMLCIIMSICLLAVKTASFQWYESQRMNGRKAPWATWLKKYKVQVIRKNQLKLNNVLIQKTLGTGEC